MEDRVPSLCETYKDYFPIGAAVSLPVLTSSRELLTRHFNSIVAGNAMKLGPIHPEEEIYQFGPADELVAFARQHGMKMRGHTLVWHQKQADWIFAGKGGAAVGRDELLTRLRDHIHTVIARYRDDVYAWDVVNEGISDSDAMVLRDSKWQSIIGDDYIDRAFEFAHEADPQARLFYNDYNTFRPAKRDRIVNLVRGMKERGSPIHGIGMQGHLNIYEPSIDLFRGAIEAYAALGVEIQITEMDMSVFRHEDRRVDLMEPTQEMLERQAERYGQLFALFREYRGVITGVTFWGVADDHNWLDNFPVNGRMNWPLLFDRQHQPKAAFGHVVRF